MIRNISILFFALSLSVTGFAAQKSNETLQKLSKKYRSAKLVEMDVEKTVKLELQGRETKYDGKIYLANGKFRWENTTPEETLLVFDGTTIWSVQTPPKEFGGAPQVARGKVDKKTKSQILISSLLGGDLEKNFKVVKEEKGSDVVKIEVAPQGNELSVKSLNLVIDAKKNQMTELSYKDDLGNLTTMKFSKIQFLKKADSSKFKYQPPKGAQVTDL
ncbi:LolA family protein [Bdellovibrio svalbardensis]|uniref:Outer membrane lipoprotein carrier protein LolA n=1 Tax=Bdellovibrio svalbardensis TaxID=2972972 RepID=A0ABT6DIS1_9BACT|nr:outer membrane lipoprotein carrier protein LolA [Bdellovibrio svalbardensis]MDG0814998.1 outer membrane lipoprotein carrier protein LolA [Bdellovibrio svalbardensis]